MSFVFHQKLNLICWYPTGELGREEILGYYQQLRDCSFGARADRYCDFSAVSGFRIDYNILYSITDYRRRFLADHTGMKLVMNSSSPIGFGMSRMYQSLMSNWDIKIFITQTPAEAANLLNVSESVLLPLDKTESSR